MNYADQAVVFGCAGESLIGVLSVPEQPFDTAVIVIVGGPQYRAGSHRQFVQLARVLARAGYAVLRFDYRGMGDSGGEQRNFENVSIDIAAAIDLMAARVGGVKRNVLWGLCDGASAALLYCHETRDARVTGLCLLNPWVRSEVGLARTHVKHYYTQRLMQREFWVKLFSGRIAPQAINNLAQSLRLATARPTRSIESIFQDRMAEAWSHFNGRLLLLLSSHDHTAKEFSDYVKTDPAWINSLQHPFLEFHTVADSNHTFTDIAARAAVEEITTRWLSSEALSSRDF